MYKVKVVDWELNKIVATYDADTLWAAQDLGHYLANYWLTHNEKIIIEQWPNKIIGWYQYKGEWEQ